MVGSVPVAQVQVPPVGIECGAESPEHLREHVLASLQLTEQDPVHITLQFELLQLTVELAPTRKSQVELALQFRLALVPAARAQVLPLQHRPPHELPQLSAAQVAPVQLRAQ